VEKQKIKGQKRVQKIEKQKIKRQKEEQKGEPRTRFEKLKLYYFVF